MPTALRPPAIPALTGLRFVAALVVVLFHIWLFAGPRGLRVPFLTDFALSVVHSGYIGVTLFFVLSGFILAYTYFDSGTSRAEFYWARVARIVPVYLFAYAFALPQFVAANFRHHHTLVLGGLSVLLMVQTWIPRYAGLLNTPAWSLSNEMAFYAVFPLLLGALLRVRDRTLAGIAAGAWLAGLVAPVLYVAMAPDGVGGRADAMTSTWWMGVIKFSPPFHFPVFALGAALGVLVRRHPIAGARWGPALTLSALGATAAVLYTHALPYPILHTAGLAPLAGLLIVGLATGRGRVARLLASRVMVRLGEASFALYLLHVPLLIYFLRLGARAGVDTHTAWFSAVFLAVALALSWGVLAGIEEPARRGLREWSERRQARRGQP